MTVLIGFVVVLLSVLGGFILSNGELILLWHPAEILIIGGAAVGAFVVSNDMHVIKAVGRAIPRAIAGTGFNRAFYVDLLSLLYDLFDKSRKQGVMSIEADVDDPESSEIFNRYPAITKYPAVLGFITDYLRIISAGNMAPHELEGLMDTEIDTRLHELEEPGHAVNKVADALPGFGIVAAVLGIVITMQSLGGPPNEIGGHVAAALVGTFMGILMAYGFVGPLSVAMEGQAQAEIKAYECIKASILATMTGLAPQMAVEFGRKVLFYGDRPGFQELNDHVKSR